MKRGEGGVTLIELAVVMSIIAIMGVCLAPAIGEWLENFRIRQAIRELSSDLQFARMKAICSGRFCTILFNYSGGGVQFDYVIFPDYDNDRVLDSFDVGDLDGDGDQENETTDIFKMVRFSDGYRHVGFDVSKSAADDIEDGITFPNNRVAFNSRGWPSTGFGGTVYLKNTKNNKGYKVVMSSVGRIRFEEYQP
jgi:prepilin-type N-terminal cleavage/methylation domain-containing protein